MSSTARRMATRQDVEKTLQKIAENQSAYYEQWLEQWVRLIEARAQHRMPLDRITQPSSGDELYLHIN